ncbi:LysR family transcriptional regulator [Pseudomonas oryzihabitans]|uniref:LysR family transcriptional regulator n=1 Tax=uncultured Pseudomonas sp. TaxID=114707 RepID=UPI0007373182|nr:LysR family transcriptional regulator [uncultured Pseudomonas sp.]KTT40526.1 LysR family transcriptional regulator [Pseudomonas psychrotolerans]KTT46711.1 LysR family transcriptional regulator [Pseudomonas psychrotolerans]
MNLKQLEFAVALAEERHFTRAAERCHVVQSALSHQIARLEAELGATLFERLPRQVRITPAGEALLVNAHQVLAAVERLQQDVAAAVGDIRGSLTVGLISSVPRLDIVELLAAFHARHPQVDIELRQDKSETLLAAVRERQLDFALIGVSRQVRLEGVDSRLLLSEELVAVLPAEHALAGRDRLSLHELVDLPLVDLPAGSGARRQTDEAFAALGLPHRVRFETSHMQLLERFVRRGLAVGLVPRSLALTFSGLACVPVSDAPQRNVHAIWSRLPTPATREFLQIVAAALGD